MEERETMGRRIAALRRQAGLTQEQVAERLGVTAQAVSKWENDVSCPDISLLPGLAELLGVSTDELLGVRPVEPRVLFVVFAAPLPQLVAQRAQFGRRLLLGQGADRW